MFILKYINKKLTHEYEGASGGENRFRDLGSRLAETVDSVLEEEGNLKQKLFKSGKKHENN